MNDNPKHQEYLRKVKEIHGKNIEITSDFLGSSKPITYKCNQCNSISTLKRAAELISKKNQGRKHSCRSCFWEKKHEDYRNQARIKANQKVAEFPHIEIRGELREQKENKLMLELFCNHCHHDWVVLASNITKATSKWKGCPECWKKSEEYIQGRNKGIEKSREQSISEAKTRFYDYLKQNSKIKSLEKYIDSKTPILFECQTCNNHWKTSPGHIMNSQSGCPQCSSGQYESKINYINDVKKIHGDNIIVLESYINSSTKILHLCTSCNEQWKVRPSSIKKGSGCSNCNSSKGESRISVFLKQNNIEFIPQWKEHQCKHYKVLPFDFYLPTYNLAIEFQGIQHERFSPPFHKTIKDLEKQQQRDKIKKEYCKLHKINFLEIWYNQYNDIEYILEEALCLNKVAVNS